MTQPHLKKTLTFSLTLLLISATLMADAIDTRTFSLASRDTSEQISAKSVNQLKKMFVRHQYDWPESADTTIPQLVLTSFPSDFGSINSTEEKKQLFLKCLAPIVLLENRKLREKRALAKVFLQFNTVDEETDHASWIRQLALRYKLGFNPLNLTSLQKGMLLKLDEIPVKLVIAQAAIESGWGTSRFALEGNSLFGQWTFNKISGLVPEGRDDDANHKIAEYPDLRSSVKAYMYNINTNRAYRELRAYRAKARNEDRAPDALELATHLHRYSQRGQDYVADLSRIIDSELFSKLDTISLQEPSAEPMGGYASSIDP